MKAHQQRDIRVQGKQFRGIAKIASPLSLPKVSACCRKTKIHRDPTPPQFQVSGLLCTSAQLLCMPQLSEHTSSPAVRQELPLPAHLLPLCCVQPSGKAVASRTCPLVWRAQRKHSGCVSIGTCRKVHILGN